MLSNQIQRQHRNDSPLQQCVREHASLPGGAAALGLPVLGAACLGGWWGRVGDSGFADCSSRLFVVAYSTSLGFEKLQRRCRIDEVVMEFVVSNWRAVFAPNGKFRHLFIDDQLGG